MLLFTVSKEGLFLSLLFVSEEPNAGVQDTKRAVEERRFGIAHPRGECNLLYNFGGTHFEIVRKDALAGNVIPLGFPS